MLASPSRKKSSLLHLSLNCDYDNPDTATNSDPPPHHFNLQFCKIQMGIKKKKKSRKYAGAPALPFFVLMKVMK